MLRVIHNEALPCTFLSPRFLPVHHWSYSTLHNHQPKQRINQIHPDGIFHPLHTLISLGSLLNIHVSKEAEEGDPEDEEDRVPDEQEGDA